MAFTQCEDRSNCQATSETSLPPPSPHQLQADTRPSRINASAASQPTLSSSILLSIGIAGAILKFGCLAPDMMGFVTSLTYSTRHVRLPSSGGTLGAMERARLLKNVRVRIGDVNVDKEVGHVVFGTLDEKSSIGRLDERKRYL